MPTNRAPSKYWGTVHFHIGCYCNTIIHIQNRIYTMTR